MTWFADVLTLYPEMFPGPLGKSLSGKALKKGIWDLNVFDLKNYGLCLLYTSPSPRDVEESRMPSSA